MTTFEVIQENGKELYFRNRVDRELYESEHDRRYIIWEQPINLQEKDDMMI